MHMSNAEAIQCLEFDKEMILFDPSTGIVMTLEEVKYKNLDNYRAYLADEVAIGAMKENQLYHELGSLEELKIAKQRIERVKPVGDHTNYRCPICKRKVRSGKGSSHFVRDNFCQGCGRVLDWSE